MGRGWSPEPCLVLSQVSFYRGAVPGEVPEEVPAARHRKGVDALWMATLPIKLPVGLGMGCRVCVCVWGGSALIAAILPTETAPL